MKNYDQIADELLKRRDEFTAERNKKRKKIINLSAIAGGFCLIAALGVGLGLGGAFNVPTSEADPGEVILPSDTLENNEPQTAGEHESKSAESVFPPNLIDSAIWDENSSADGSIVEWEGKKVEYRLYTTMNDPAYANELFAVSVSFLYPDEQLYNYVHEGKTVSEYAREAEKEIDAENKLSSLLKEGDYLKYGEALYTTGTPDGEKWSKSFYDERIAYYGKELLDKYIVDGRFLKEQVGSDLESLAEHKARYVFYAASAAFYQHISEESAEKTGGKIPYEIDPVTKKLTVFVTSDQLKELELDYSPLYSLARKNTDDGQIVFTE